MPTCGDFSPGQWFGQHYSKSQTRPIRTCIFFSLLFVVILVFYCTDIGNSTWLKQYNAAYSVSSLSSQRIVPPKPKAAPRRSTTNLPSRTEPAIIQTTRKRTPSKLTPSVIRPVTHKPSPAPKPVPYVSPGPYVVEYPYDYQFVINEAKACEEKKPFLLLMVPVAPNNRAHRDIIRQTWGKATEVMGKVVKLFFVLGLKSGQPVPHLDVQRESQEHHDLIQSNFLDCYKNLTIKTMVMLKWMDSYCSTASYAMKVDSDVFLNLETLVKMLLNAPKTNYLTGEVATRAQVIRNPKSKWYLPVSAFSPPVYPRYALGYAYVLSLDLARKLLEAAPHVKALYIEDVFLGLCMKYLNIPLTDPPNWGYFHVFPVRYNRCAYSKLVSTTLYESTDRVWLWNDFQKSAPKC